MINSNANINVEQLPHLLNAADVAEILNIGCSTVYQLINREQLACVRIGRSVRVRPGDLQVFIENRLHETCKG